MGGVDNCAGQAEYECGRRGTARPPLGQTLTNPANCLHPSYVERKS